MIQNNSAEILFPPGNNDECYTPDYGVTPILKYIPENAVVWCPFDKEDSEFVKQISKTNKVITSHIDNGQDFYKYEPTEHWDIIISNPPFTKKKNIFERALSFDKPFALIAPLTWLNDSAVPKLFMNIKCEMLIFDKRMRFLNNGQIQKKITFSSMYLCHNFLPQQLIFEKLERND